MRCEDVTGAADARRIRSLFLFDGVPEAADTLAALTAVTFEAGDTIYAEDTFDRALGVLLDGKAVAEPAGDGKAVLTVFHGGDVFGAAALFGGGEAYVSRVRAVKRCRVLFLSEACLRALFAAYPQTAVNYIAFLSSRVRFLNGKIALFTQHGAARKVYEFLLARCDEQGRVSERVNRSRLAETLGLGRTSVYRALDTLEEKQLIVREDGRIQVIR